MDPRIVPSAIIFDMDGVLVDSEPLHEQAFLEIFGRLGLRDRHGIDFTQYYGKSDRAVWLDFIAQHHPQESLAELSAEKEKLLIDRMRQLQPLFPGVSELLSRLCRQLPLALASGSNHAVIQSVLQMADLHRCFSAVVSAQDLAHGKPAPDIFLYAAQKIGVPAHRCWVIEDSVAGVTAGKSAGMTVIAITHSVPAHRLAAADQVVSNYEELAKCFSFAAS